ncbi:ABC transporter permease [Marinobacter persicus]|uniref:Osmoprotectant transport system permease protein n=1 Tax=Marinobacter persicus TaxID=930118 RepID=A0A2S6G6S9_9GAMM|nr:ABC transporter permease [Marinobacter persicus]PPK51644.1 osmoprotectant transport system permease protein [Marinobacter persicus]PPK54864.1 osmoprotectant transport system permease protein [Marinobacter persicus]PPK58582.1 osmoprotectant transport system permease protein [Marinobacter persicus]
MRIWLPPLLLALLLCGLSVGMDTLQPLFQWLQPDKQGVIYKRESFLFLLQNHLPLVNQVASIGQTFPPVAVLALAVPALGFGEAPIVVALILYGLLPILRNTLAGLEGLDPAVREAARGMGMSPMQVLLQVELPLAGRVILAGIRTSVTINIATAAIGSTIGARTLGDPVIAGLVNGNTAYVLQGAILIGLLALTTDSLFEAIQRSWDRRLSPSVTAS